MEKKNIELSPRQREAFEFIRDYQARNGYGPSNREICKALNLQSPSTSHGIIIRLQEKGYITHQPKSPRSIRITDQEDEMSRLRKRVAELEALLQLRQDIATIDQHDGMIAAVLDELKAVGI